MSEEDLELIRRGYEALNRGDVDAWLDTMHTDVELHEFPDHPDMSSFRGHDGLRKWFEDSIERLTDEFSFEPRDMTAYGTAVLVTVHAVGTARGATVEARVYHLFEVRNGKVARIRGFLDHADAVEASGRATR